MWALINKNLRRYSKISLFEERQLISTAQKGSKESKEELILRHISFLTFRIHRKVFPEFLNRFGEDLLGEGILLINTKIRDYDLDYLNKQGDPNPVRFKSYIWKRIDGFIIDYLKKELSAHKLLRKYAYESDNLM